MPLIDWNKSLGQIWVAWLGFCDTWAVWTVWVWGMLWLGKWLALIELCLLTTKNHKSTSNREEWFDILRTIRYTLPATRRQIIDSQTVFSSVRPVTATTVASLKSNSKECFTTCESWEKVPFAHLTLERERDRERPPRLLDRNRRRDGETDLE